MYKIILGLFFSATAFSYANIQTRTQVLMGTYVHISLPEENQTQLSHSFRLISNLEHILSTFAKDALLYTLNDQRSIAAHPVLKDAIEKSITYHGQTHGYFDITIGSMTKKLYHFGEDVVASPSDKELKNAELNIQGIHLTPNTIRLDDNITLDLGGMGKGYAVDKVAEYLEDQNITEGKIALSGDIRCLTRCELFIQSPFSEALFARVSTQLSNASISTSGTYRRYATKKEEHHLIDPKKRAPQDNFSSVSLFSVADNSRLDAFATAVSVMPKTAALSFLACYPDISFILVEHDGTVLFNDKRNLLHIQWIPYKEAATIQTSNASKEAYNKRVNTLIHPNISQPIEIKR